MIGKLTGIVSHIDLTHMIVDVSGVGYVVHCSQNTLASAKLGTSIALFIETYVREDQITLYGFVNLQDKFCFLKLVTVKGVGPKIALQILSHLKAEQVFSAIMTQSSSAFSQISGLGAKLIGRILAELKDKDFGILLPQSDQPTLKEDAISALVHLGISRFEAASSVSKVLAERAGIDLNALIKLALSTYKQQIKASDV
jgi:Holliday junction DNA helicase RuvA